MKIHNTVPYFMENFAPTEDFLRQYHEKFSPHFKEYFLYHCKNVDEKITKAIQIYLEKLSDIKESNDKIEGLIKQVQLTYEQKYDVEFTKDVHIIVGAFGSNAFTHRQIIPEVTFCLERLSPKDEHLKVIIAHEFGHALHHILSDQEGMNWPDVNWNNPFIWLLQEGCATYFSKQVTTADEPVYFSYDDHGEEWLNFAKDHQTRIVSTFIEDSNQQSPAEIFREWFSINGGRHFGYTRLAYYIAYVVLERLIEKHGERQAVTFWKDPNFSNEVNQVLIEVVK
ncbi:DUF5700 domain-containing putative Zn-dependent protease [Alkalibacillus haloalkaliphilus]|uniref:DUF5700 domain-containing putative Zn-dependent protease n=1 Tax=Alkalibacillus haloalkaliphilus TaxID=94136 RepID=UPI0029361A03|nr:DUF5700 domain-containing putative Zn-dependent protease [Alkalibacillus haloalkaliphilus]MDV2580908.1 DUF5700 domain-containing putative Zn-dependent protease [Alkalibacillus haloalkaliphilus]